MYWRCHGLPEISFALPPKRNGPSSRVPTCQLAGLLYEIQNLFWLWRLQGPINLDVFFIDGPQQTLDILREQHVGYLRACMWIYMCAHTCTYRSIKSTCLYMSTYMHTYVSKFVMIWQYTSMIKKFRLYVHVGQVYACNKFGNLFDHVLLCCIIKSILFRHRVAPNVGPNQTPKIRGKFPSTLWMITCLTSPLKS